MAHHNIAEPVAHLTHSIHDFLEALFVTRETDYETHVNSELPAVLERAADEDAFIAELTRHGSEALRNYNLSLEEKAAIVSGDIRWLEARIGKLNDRLSTWPNCRLQQESW